MMRRSPKPKKRLLACVVAAASALLALCGPSRAVADGDDPKGYAARAGDLTIAMEDDKARAELAKADPNSPAVVLAKARLALYEEDCDLTAALLARAEVGQMDEGRLIADVGRGCARVTAATVVDKDDDGAELMEVSLTTPRGIADAEALGVRPRHRGEVLGVAVRAAAA